MLSIFHNSHFLPRSSTKGLQDDLKWWIRILQQLTVSRAIPHPLPYMMFTATQTPAQKLALPSPSETDGEHGVLYLAGSPLTASEISDGLKLLHLNASLEASSKIVKKLTISSHTVLSKVGGTGAAGTELSTEFSRGCTQSLQTAQFNTLFTQATYAARIIQPTPHQEESTHQHISSSLPSSSLQNSTGSSLTLNPHSPQQNNTSSEEAVTQQLLPKGSRILMNGIKLASDTALSLSDKMKSDKTPKSFPSQSKFDQSLSTNSITRKAPLKPYRTDLTPLPSALRPHCLVRDRLCLWCPSKSRLDNAVGGLKISEIDLDCILHVINVLWAQGTRDIYGAGLLVFHVFCNLWQIPEDEHCPASLLDFGESPLMDSLDYIIYPPIYSLV
jgi:hypothetical protein